MCPLPLDLWRSPKTSRDIWKCLISVDPVWSPAIPTSLLVTSLFITKFRSKVLPWGFALGCCEAPWHTVMASAFPSLLPFGVLSSAHLSWLWFFLPLNLSDQILKIIVLDSSSWIVNGCCWAVKDGRILGLWGEKFNLGPVMRLDSSKFLCDKVLLKYERDRESFWHRHPKGPERAPPSLV